MSIENPEVVEEFNEQEERLLLASLGGDDSQDFDPDQSGTTQQRIDQEAILLAQGKATVVTVLGVSEQLLKQFGHKDFAFDPSQVENVAESAAPLFKKYDGEMPPWLAAYKEEITFTLAAGALGFTSYQQIRMLKASDKAKVVNEEEQDAVTNE